MTALTEGSFHQAYLVRTVERQLLEGFAAGKLAGTTHTCTGQEMCAVALAAALDKRRDVVVSNHRCHGHYLAWTDDVEGLIAEVMGRETGVCGGIGGSQHLCADGFFSNGIQGGIVPVAAGLAYAKKLEANGGIAAVCIGDGTLGEGVVYETFNMAAKWRLPLLIVLENNSYAQSTAQAETLAGDICARAAAFGIETFEADTWNPEGLVEEMCRAAALVRTEGVPAFVRVDTYRLNAHSKGDDNRDPLEIQRHADKDPLNLFIARSGADQHAFFARIRERVALAVERAERASSLPADRMPRLRSGLVQAGWLPALPAEAGSQLESINRALREWLSTDPRVLLLGEDIRSPYGGAFKVTREISDSFPDRVINTPISEAGIVGIANGLALAGRRPVVEIMFGDFLGLCFDQILNHAAKFHGMYNGRVASPLVIRTPMGGGRGYGPTHSQNVEKHFAGIPGLRVLVMHGRTRVVAMYETLRACTEPVLIVENKLLYRARGDEPLPPGYSLYETRGAFPATLLRPDVSVPDLTLVAFGRMSVLAESVAAMLAQEEEIFAELIFPLGVAPFDPWAVLESIGRTGKLVVVEEGAAHFDLASEVISLAATEYRGKHRLRVRRLAAQPRPIPSAPALERETLPSLGELRAACEEIFDE